MEEGSWLQPWDVAAGEVTGWREQGAGAAWREDDAQAVGTAGWAWEGTFSCG